MILVYKWDGELRPVRRAQTGLRNTIWYVFRNLLLT